MIALSKGSALASASSITPTHDMHHVTGNIGRAFSALSGTVMPFVYDKDTQVWYPVYN